LLGPIASCARCSHQCGLCSRTLLVHHPKEVVYRGSDDCVCGARPEAANPTAALGTGKAMKIAEISGQQPSPLLQLPTIHVGHAVADERAGTRESYARLREWLPSKNATYAKITCHLMFPARMSFVECSPTIAWFHPTEGNFVQCNASVAESWLSDGTKAGGRLSPSWATRRVGEFWPSFSKS